MRPYHFPRSPVRPSARPTLPVEHVPYSQLHPPDVRRGGDLLVAPGDQDRIWRRSKRGESSQRCPARVHTGGRQRTARHYGLAHTPVTLQEIREVQEVEPDLEVVRLTSDSAAHVLGKAQVRAVVPRPERSVAPRILAAVIPEVGVLVDVGLPRRRLLCGRGGLSIGSGTYRQGCE